MMSKKQYNLAARRSQKQLIMLYSHGAAENAIGISVSRDLPHSLLDIDSHAKIVTIRYVLLE
jgi:hypothetical protein